MKRTPPWVFVAAAMVQLAGLGFCVWAMEHCIRDAEEGESKPRPRPALAPAPPAPLAALVIPPVPPPAKEPLPLPAFIADGAQGPAQVLSGEIGGRSLIFGLFGDGKIKFVDVDGSRYQGTTESARARMREVGGTRAFTVRLDEAGEGLLLASFTGGAHDNATIGLSERVGRSIL
jgi:hypothetical protein